MHEVINIALLAAIRLWKAAREQDPNAHLLTDDDVINLLAEDAAGVARRGQAWLDANKEE